MGSSESKEEKKTVDATGQVNNSIVLEEGIDIKNVEIVILLYVICIIKILELVIYIYRWHNSKIKKKYSSSKNQQSA